MVGILDILWSACSFVFARSKRLELFKHKIENIQPRHYKLSDTSISPTGHLLHVKERMEERVYKLSSHDHEPGQIGLHCIVDHFIVIYGLLKILFQLWHEMNITANSTAILQHTLNKFFSSFNVFSFFSLSLVSELLCLS